MQRGVLWVTTGRLGSTPYINYEQHTDLRVKPLTGWELKKFYVFLFYLLEFGCTLQHSKTTSDLLAERK